MKFKNIEVGNTNLFYSNDELKAINNYKFNKDL